jgi:hypothetical protein
LLEDEIALRIALKKQLSSSASAPKLPTMTNTRKTAAAAAKSKDSAKAKTAAAAATVAAPKAMKAAAAPSKGTLALAVSKANEEASNGIANASMIGSSDGSFIHDLPSDKVDGSSFGGEDNLNIEVASNDGSNTRAKSKAAARKKTSLLKLLNKASGAPASTPVSALECNANGKASKGLEQALNAVMTKTDAHAEEQTLANAAAVEAEAEATRAQDAMNLAIANAKAAADKAAAARKKVSQRDRAATATTAVVAVTPNVKTLANKVEAKVAAQKDKAAPVSSLGSAPVKPTFPV